MSLWQKDAAVRKAEDRSFFYQFDLYDMFKTQQKKIQHKIFQLATLMSQQQQIQYDIKGSYRKTHC